MDKGRRNKPNNLDSLEVIITTTLTEFRDQMRLHEIEELESQTFFETPEEYDNAPTGTTKPRRYYNLYEGKTRDGKSILFEEKYGTQSEIYELNGKPTDNEEAALLELKCYVTGFHRLMLLSLSLPKKPNLKLIGTNGLEINENMRKRMAKDQTTFDVYPFDLQI